MEKETPNKEETPNKGKIVSSCIPQSAQKITRNQRAGSWITPYLHVTGLWYAAIATRAGDKLICI
tara:strand:+ start:5079 stop:5273 length:195 start_codon:yes stop_codon:yes gene_type:complete